MKQGIALLALGSYTYGHWAYQLLKSIRYYSPAVKCQLITDGKAISNLNEKQLSAFDVITTINHEDCTKVVDLNTRSSKTILNPSLAKIRLYDYYTFDETLFIDVDSICIDDISPLFDNKEDYKVNCLGVTDQQDGVYSNMLWMNIGDMRQLFNLTKPIPGTNTAVQFIRKSEYTKSIYESAYHYYRFFDEHCTAENLHMKWGRVNHAGRYVYPDELFFNAALSEIGEDYAFDPMPMFFQFKQNRGEEITESNLQKKGYRFVGYWGDKAYNGVTLRTFYDRMMRKYMPGEMYVKIHTLMKSKFVTQKV